MQSPTPIKVAYYQRKPRPEGNFSIESIFADLQTRLAGRIEAVVHTSSWLNDGVTTKFKNILEAGRRSGDEDVAHITGEVHFLDLLLPKRKVVLTIHDCRFMERKSGNALVEKAMQWLYLRGPVAKATIVTTVSETTKADIIRHTGCAPPKIRVIPVTVDEAFRPSPKPFNEARPNVLQIGTVENKNLERLVEALAPLDCTLTIVGRLSEAQLELLRAHRIDYTNHFNIPGEELIGLYRACDVLAFVSTFEGFGMPIVEANLTERVVLTSNLSSMPEVAGPAALQVDPYSVASIREGLQRLFTEPELREQLLAAGRQNRTRFDPETVANQYLSCYRDVAGPRPINP